MCSIKIEVSVMRVCGENFKILEMFTLSVTMGNADIVAENMFVV